MDFTIPEDLQLLKQTVRDYVRRRLLPISQQIEKEDRIPEAIRQEMAEMGFFGFPFPEEYGGVGAGELGYCLALEELGAANAAVSNLIGAHTSIGAMSIYLDGTEEQKQKYLLPLAQGRKIAAFSLTEPGAGSDAASIQTTATRQGDAYLLNGTKIWVTNGPIADVVTVFAVTDRSLGARGGVTAFIVEKEFPGFRVGKVDEKMGLRGSYTSELIFEDCVVPAANVLGQVGLGFVTAMKTLDVGRISLGAGAVGASQYLLDTCIEHARQRVQFGKPIAANQAVQWMLVDMATEVHAARLMVYHAATKIDRGEKASREAAIVKLYCSEMACRVADQAVQVFGGMGYMKEHFIERAYRDARILRIYEGTNEVQRMVIAEDLLRSAAGAGR